METHHDGVQFNRMPDDAGVSRSLWDEMEDWIKNSIVTPVEIFFFALFVFGVLSLAATTLVGNCGNVDDFETTTSDRSLDPIPGATAILTRAVVFGDTVAGPGTCVLIERVNEIDGEDRSANVHILAKAQPFFTGDIREYKPLAPFENFFSAPVSAVLFLHKGTPKGEISLSGLSVVETQTYTSWFRNFYLNTIYIMMIVLGVLLIGLMYVGARYEKMRKTWFSRHELRATYISRLMQDKAKTRELQDNWEKISAVMEENRSEEWKNTLILLQETLGGTLKLLRFEGENLMETLQTMKEEDLWCIEKLWEANSLIVRTQGQVEEGEPIPAVTEKVMKKVMTIHMTALIWLGLLPHHLAN